MKKTILFQNHVNLGAKIVEFAGFEMPIQYTGINAEHLAVRNAAGIFDVSHMGEFSIRGEKSLDLLQKTTSNDVSKLKDGGIQYSTLLNKNGGIIDDLLIYKIKSNDYFIVVNASNIQKDWEWILQNNTYPNEVKTENLSDNLSLIALQGPKALKILQKLTRSNIEILPYYHFIFGNIAGIENILISNTGYTGAGGFELCVPNDQAVKLWNSLLEAGREYEILPCGLAARDTLRLEMGYCLYGNELNENITPIEASLGWITKLNKENFFGKELFIEQKKNGVSKKLIGFELLDKGIPRHGYKLLNDKNETIGTVTSGTMSPIRKIGLGMAYIKPEYAGINSEFFVEIRDKKLKAKVAKLPFI